MLSTAIPATGISDHLPSILLNKSKATKVTLNSENKSKFVIKRQHTTIVFLILNKDFPKLRELGSHSENKFQKIAYKCHL